VGVSSDRTLHISGVIVSRLVSRDLTGAGGSDGENSAQDRNPLDLEIDRLREQRMWAVREPNASERFLESLLGPDLSLSVVIVAADSRLSASFNKRTMRF
jgi:hypothetical protein